MENVRGSFRVKFAQKERLIVYCMSKTPYCGYVTSSELALIKLANDTLELAQTLYVGAVTLDLSKSKFIN